MDAAASSPPETAATARQRAIAGWGSPRAALVSALLVFAALSGLWIYLGPFSAAAQVLVLLHTVAGLFLLVPYVRYQVAHFLDWFRQRLTAVMVLGYALATTVLTSLVTGLVVTWQAAFGTRLSPTWDLVHLVSGIAALALLAVHLPLALARRRATPGDHRELVVASRRFVRRGLVTLGATAVVLAVGALAWHEPRFRRPVPTGYSLPRYAQSFDEYKGNPFAPTMARTEDLQLVEPALLGNSASCGSAGCHAEIYAEWQPGAHRFAAMNAPFQEVQRRFAADREPAETRYCAGCHDPISLFAGAKDIANQSLSSPGVDEGISCVACHAISQVDQRGNADFVLTPPRRYLGETSTGLAKWVSDYLIRAYPRQHLADYDRNLLRTPELCGACHKQFIPEALNRFGNVPGQNQYDEWKNGHWHSEDPAIDLSCRDCHMRLVRGSHDPGRGEGGDTRRRDDDGAHRHHGFIATNDFMPAVLKLPHWEEQVRLTEEWMRGETVLPELAGVWPSGPVAALELHAPAQVAPGQDVEVRVTVVNRKAGHNFITGPLDFVRSWVHLKAVDSEGRVLAEWGALDPETRHIQDRLGEEHQIGNKRDEGTLVLEALPIDEKGELLRRHELWRSAGGKGKRVIFPTYSDAHLYRFRLPATSRGEVTLEAELNYCRYRQEFLDLVLPELETVSGVRQPVIVQATASRRFNVSGGPSLAAGGG